MNTTISGKYRVSADVTGTRAKRIRLQKRDGHGKYIGVNRPWRRDDVMAMQTVRRMVNLLAQGISDTDDIVAVVNKPRRSRRRGTNKPPIASAVKARHE
jgi:hypothetical protein